MNKKKKKKTKEEEEQDFLEDKWASFKETIKIFRQSDYEISDNLKHVYMDFAKGAFEDKMQERKFRSSYKNKTIDKDLRSLGSYYKKVRTNKEMKKKSEKLVVFFGFQGKLARQYCIVDGDKKELSIRMNTIGSMLEIPWSLHEMEKWNSIVSEEGKDFKKVEFEDAMSVIRSGDYEEKKEELVTFQESDVDEFDEDCTADCTPGDHKCGK